MEPIVTNPNTSKDKTTMKLSQAIEFFVEQGNAHNSIFTQEGYRSKLTQHLLPYLGDVDVQAISVAEVQAFKKHLITRDTKKRGSRTIKGKLSPYTIKSILASVKSFSRWLTENNYIEQNLAANLVIPTPPPPDPKAISRENVIKMLETAAMTGDEWLRYRNVALIYTFFDTGGRLSSITYADISHLDLERGRLESIGKGNKLVTLRLLDVTVAALRSWLNFRQYLKPMDHKLFITKKGTGLKPKGVYSALRAIAENANVVGRWNPHAFRHGWARDALIAGADLSHVSQLLHHSSIVVTANYYARWADDELHDIHRRFSPGTNIPAISPIQPDGCHGTNRENLEKSGVQRQTLMKTNSKEKANEPTRVILP